MTEFSQEEVFNNISEKSVNKTILCENPLIYTIDNYLTEEECEHFINVSKNNLQRAYVSDIKTGTVSRGRTGSNFWLRHNNDDTTVDVGTRIAKLVDYPLENAEAYQVVYYDETQKYDSHYDAYTKNDSDKCLRCLKYGGQRMVTALVYLNDVEEGGHTKFDKLNINVEPKKGRLLVFYNTLPGTNTVHPESLHAGCPVISGHKYAFNLWFREISMKKIYDFPFLKDKEKEEGIRMNIEENKDDTNDNIINIDSSKVNVSINVYSKNPYISHYSNALTKNECLYIKSKCVNGNSQNRGRVSYWVNLKDNDMLEIRDKLSDIMGLSDGEYFENMNIINYPKDCDHGYHYDAFDLNSERGKEFSRVRGQRLYTIIGLLDENLNVSSGSIKFRNMKKSINMSQGDLCVYKNYLNNSAVKYQRDTSLEYMLSSVKDIPKYYFYLYVREKTRDCNTIPLSVIMKIETKIEEIKENNIILSQVDKVSDDKLKEQLNRKVQLTETVQSNQQTNVNEKKDEGPNTENYYTTLQNFYDEYSKNNRLIPHRKLGFRRVNSPKDEETINGLIKIRNNFMINDVNSLINPDVLKVDYKQDEYTPVVVNNVFSEEAGKIISEYYHNTIDNEKFQFGDRQAQRWKAYDDFMSRVIQFETLPLIEHIAKKRLKPTYTYLSCYAKGADLPAHTDRPECEFTVSFLIDKPSGTNWPIYVDKEKQPIKFKGRYRNYVNSEHIDNCVPVDCEPNGLMMFCGTDHIHFREKLEHDYYYITLLHYMTY